MLGVSPLTLRTLLFSTDDLDFTENNKITFIHEIKILE